MKPVKNLPGSVQWLLDFANLGCIPGELNPQRFKSYHQYRLEKDNTNKNIPKIPRLARPSINLAPFLKKCLTKYDYLEILGTMSDDFMIARAKNGELILHGGKRHPTIEEFQGFFLKGFNEKSDYNMFRVYWRKFQSVFYRIIQENDKEELHFIVKKDFEDVKEKPAHELLQVVFECVWDFWNNQRALHSLLRQCPCCGAFWIAKEKKGRGKPQKYCYKKCENEFNQASRRKNSKASRDCKKRKRKKSRRDKETELISHFKNRGHTLQEAEVLAWTAMRNGETIEDYSQNK